MLCIYTYNIYLNTATNLVKYTTRLRQNLANKIEQQFIKQKPFISEECHRIFKLMLSGVESNSL